VLDDWSPGALIPPNKTNRCGRGTAFGGVRFDPAAG
jgi:hypothetical protein